MGILASLFAVDDRRRERRFHPSQTPPDWAQWGSMETAAGVDVSPDTSLQLSTVFACVRVLAETQASLPLVMYERDGENRRRATGHYLYSLLHDLPNPEMTSFDLRETLMGHLATWGNAYVEKEFNRAGRVMGLWPLRPDRMRVARVNGELVYFYRVTAGGPEEPLASNLVMHLRSLSSDGIVGYSPIALQRQALGLAFATEAFGARLFSNDARPGGILEHPGILGETAYKNLLDNWESRHQGLSRKHRIAILEEGMKFHEVGIPPEDAQFLQTRKFQVEEIARIYRVPLHMVGNLDRATFSNIEQQSIEFVVFTMLPWLKRWEQAVARDLLMPAERGRYLVEFLVDGLLRGDTQSRYAAYATGRQWGWLSANDVRRLENQNPVAGGDVYMMPLNMVPSTGSGDGSPSTGSPSTGSGGAGVRAQTFLGPAGSEERQRRSVGMRRALRETHVGLLRQAATRLVSEEAAAVTAAAARLLGQRDLPQFDLWLAEYYGEFEATAARGMWPALQVYAEAVALAAADEMAAGAPDMEALGRFMSGYGRSYGSRHAAQSAAAIRAILAAHADDPLAAIEAGMADWRQARPGQIAQEEGTRANNAAAKFVYGLAGAAAVRWLAFGDSCPYCRQLDGQTVGIGDWFLAAGVAFAPEGAERPLTPQRNVGHPPAHDGCDCFIVSG